MCGISGIFGSNWNRRQLEAMISIQHHRGPDGSGVYFSPRQIAGLGHNRLSIIDLSSAGQQPMSTPDGRFRIVLNGEIYNYLELRSELADYTYRSRTDTEVILAAYQRWGRACLDHFIGMFAFLLWDEQEQSLFAARDRFGVKPLNYCVNDDGTLFIASEIKALHAAGVPAEFDTVTWSTYLALGVQDNSERTFWQGIKSLAAGHALSWQRGELKISRWYDLAAGSGEELDQRPLQTVQDEYLSLLAESVRLRFRADVPVGINLSGGLDSSTLLGLVQQLQGSKSEVSAYSFVTGDKDYDELPWVEQMLEHTHHPLRICRITPESVPELAASVQAHQDEPFGGLPTLAYARLFELAHADGTTVLLDGQGMDEQWAGYDYYLAALNGNISSKALIQGTKESPVKPECLMTDFLSLAAPFEPAEPFPDRLRNMQYRDARYTKIPRALRFNDRISMRSSTELREPFLDHRLFELALRQPPERKIADGTRKWFQREISKQLLPAGVVQAPKRALQTPQREWLRGPLKGWATECLEEALAVFGQDWLKASAVRETWQTYCNGAGDNSFYVWQWISLGLMSKCEVPAADVRAVTKMSTYEQNLTSFAADDERAWQN